MVDTFTPSLGLINMTTGSHVNTWGEVENDDRTLVDQAVAGQLNKDLTGLTSVTLDSTQGVSNEARNATYYFFGALAADCTVTVPSVTKQMLVVNATTGGFNVIVTTSGGTGVTMAASTANLLYCDGTNVNIGVAGLVPPITITQGGTGSTTAAGARTALGLGTAAQLDAGTGDANVPTGTNLKGTVRPYSATQYPATVTIAYAVSIALDLSIHQDAKITTAGSITLANPSNMVSGITGNLELVNGGGTDTLAYDTAWRFVGGLRPTIGTGVGAVTLLSWRCNGTIMEAALNPGFS